MSQWNIIVVTCPTASLAIHVEQEIEFMRKKGRMPQHVPVLAIEDPAEAVGSGAATLNALLVATEYLSVQNNYSVINSDILATTRILIIHQGRQCVFSASMKSFIPLPRTWETSRDDVCFEHCASGLFVNGEILLQLLEKLSVSGPPGVWVCSTDMTLLVPKKKLHVNWENSADALLFCVPVDIEYATNHGCVALDDKGMVTNVLYASSKDILQKYAMNDGKALIISGIVFLTPLVAESLLAFHLKSPLESCTYIGLDSGAEPIQASLFFDILVSMASNISQEEFVNGLCGRNYNMRFGYLQEQGKQLSLVRSLVWKALSKFKMTAEVLKNCTHFYWNDHLPAKYHMENLFSMQQDSVVHSLIKGQIHSTECGKLLMNSVLNTDKVCTVSSNSAIVNSRLDLPEIVIGDGCYVYGLNTNTCNMDKLIIPENTVVLSYTIPNDTVVAVFGTSDHLKLCVTDQRSTFMNKSWSDLFIRLKIDERDLWDASVLPSQRTLLTAKLFAPMSECSDFLILNSREKDVINLERWKSCRKFSLNNLVMLSDHGKMMRNRRNIYAEISAEKVKNVLHHNESSTLVPLFLTSYAEGWSDLLMDTLDQILLSETNSIVLTRTLSSMADLLAVMAGKCGGLRAGPGSNKSWLKAFKLLLAGDMLQGMQSLIEERKNWMDRPSHIMRAARHYERAAQILIHNSVQSAKKYMTFTSAPLPELGHWVFAECPARIDLQGGWTDTPPICYELGGSVVNVAVLMDGKKPIGAKACRKNKLNIELFFGSKDSPSTLVIEDVNEVMDFDQPYATGALFKAALVCANIIDLNVELPLQGQLMRKCQSGIILHAWSDLPHGCGMGASSILAGAVVAVLWSISGKEFDKESVVHAVLHIEQLLTTGGGWQDQVGGILGGVSRGFCDAFLPLHVKRVRIPIDPSILKNLERHFLLMYTGKVRLAKNILQTVIRNWYARDFTIVNCFKTLISSSYEMEEALKNGDLPKIGELMNRYWEQKKILAPGCEPASVRKIMDALKCFCHGQILTGAGGGGFMCILTKEPDAKEKIEKLIPLMLVGTYLLIYFSKFNLQI